MKLINYHQQLKLLFLKSRRLNSGFIMMEVLVGIFIIVLFTGITMQIMLTATLLKARAQQYSEANAWIQQDLEDIKYQATIYKSTSLTVTATIGQSSIVVAAANDFEVNDKLKIGTDNTTYAISSISGNNLTITPGLAIAQPVSSAIIANQSIRCGTSASPATITTGFADAFQDKITGSNITTASNNFDITKTSSTSGRQFRLRRSTTITDVPSYNVLQINYSISEILSGATFAIVTADRKAEVVPTVSFLCPR